MSGAQALSISGLRILIEWCETHGDCFTPDKDAKLALADLCILLLHLHFL